MLQRGLCEADAFLAFVVLVRTSVFLQKVNRGPGGAAALDPDGFQNRLEVAGSSHVLELAGEMSYESAKIGTAGEQLRGWSAW
jgi:hypothetical protein